MPRYRYKAQDGTGGKVRGVIYAADEGELHLKLRNAELLPLTFKEDEVKANFGAFKTNILSDFNRQLGMLISSGISLVRSLNIMIQEESIGPRQRAIYEDILRLIRQGLPISDSLEAQRAFPPLMVSMYRAAEAGGNLEKTANRLAVKYDKDYRLTMKIKKRHRLYKGLKRFNRACFDYHVYSRPAPV